MVDAIFFSLSADRTEYHDEQRVIIRINAITLAGHSLPGDEDDWIVDYPAALVTWLTNILALCDWKWSIPQILDTERQYPGLIDAVDVVLWQRQLIKEQIKSEA